MVIGLWGKGIVDIADGVKDGRRKRRSPRWGKRGRGGLKLLGLEGGKGDGVAGVW